MIPFFKNLLLISDRDTETKFRNHIFEIDRSWFRSLLVISIILTILFALLQLIDAGSIDVTLPRGVQTLYFLLCLGVTYNSTLFSPKNYQTSTFILILGCFFSFFWMQSTGYMPEFYLTNVIIIFLFTINMVAGLQFQYLIYINTLAFIGYLYYANYLGNEFDKSQIPNLFSVFMFSSVIGRLISKHKFKLFEKDQTIGDYQMEMEQKNKKLKELDDLKSKILGVISHDLRAPITSLQQVLSLMETAALSPDELRMLLPKLKRQFETTQNYINRLALWSKSQLTGYQVQKEDLNFNSLLEQVIQRLKPEAESRNLRIINQLDPEITIFADKNLFESAISNILGNAVKYTHANTDIEISMNKDADKKFITIKDYGPGIEEKYLDNLFEITKNSSMVKGIGLGLYLSRDFIEKNGGKISVKSEMGKGTTFILSCPADC